MKKLIILLLTLGCLMTQKQIVSSEPRGLGEQEMLANLIYLISQKSDNAKLAYESFKAKGYNVNAYRPAGDHPKSDYQLSPLTTAILFYNNNALSWLLPDADLEARNDLGMTPLHYTAIADNPRIAAALLEKGADINAQDANGDTLAHLKIVNHPEGHSPSLDEGWINFFLTNKNVNLNLENKQGVTPLRLAENASAEMVSAAPAERRKEAQFFIDELMKALKKEQTPEQFYKKVGAPAHEPLPEPENEGAALSQFISLIMDGIATIDQYRNLVSSKGYDPNVYLQAEGGLPFPGISILIAAIHSNNTQLIKNLLKEPVPKKIDVNAKNKYDSNRSPIHYAVLADKQLIVELLIENGANVNIPDDLGDTPLHLLIREHEKIKDSQPEKAEGLRYFILGLVVHANADLTLPNTKSEVPLTMLDFDYYIKNWEADLAKRKADLKEKAYQDELAALQQAKDKIAAAKAKIAGGGKVDPAKKSDDKALIDALNKLQQDLTVLQGRLQNQ